MYWPPSTLTTVPVTCRARSEHRNATASATSEGAAARPSTVYATALSNASLGSFFVISVSTSPGATTFTFTW